MASPTRTTLRETTAIVPPAPYRSETLISRDALTVRSISASAHVLHNEITPETFNSDPDDMELWLMRPAEAALVLASSWAKQPLDEVAIKTGRVEICRRGSGGGAVYICPNDVSWTDFWIPKTASIYRSDPSELFLNIGAFYQKIFASLGLETAIVKKFSGSEESSRYACWAGRGYGELTVADAKLLGLAQRRNRRGARIQAMVCFGTSAAKVLDYIDTEGKEITIPSTHVTALQEHRISRESFESRLIGSSALTNLLRG